jgi:hypothetical protein
MRTQMPLLTWGICFSLLACGGPSGTITGKVVVEGGNAANVPVFVFGPQSAASVSGADGAFSATGLPDGAYVVRATVRGAEVEEQSAPAVLKGGKVEAEPTLTFKFSTGKLTGKVVFADGSDAAGLTVALSGAANKGAKTGSGGAFSFEALPNGSYVVSVEAPNTKEGRVGLGVTVAGPTDAGELKLTPVGSVSGTVNFMAMGAAGVQVSVPGTQLVATTDSMGKFVFPNVPTGMVTLLARQGLAPFSRSKSAMATVARGTNADVMIDLEVDPPVLATVKGVVTFFGPQDPTAITVNVPGTMYTTKPAKNGAFTISVPEGRWDLVATAKHHPKQVIAKLNLRAGETLVLPASVLSWFEDVAELNSPLTDIGNAGVTSKTPWAAVNLTDGTTRKTLLVNTATKEVRTLTSGSYASAVQFSAASKFIGFTLNGSMVTYEIATGEMKARGVSGPFSISTDETVLFVARAGGLDRIVLATDALTRFPTTGNVTAAISTNDRWTIRDATNVVRLITPTSDHQLFTNVNQLSTAGFIWATTDCAPVLMVNSCTLRVVGPTATSPNAAAFRSTTGFVTLLSAAGTFASFGDSTGNFITNVPTAVSLALPANISTTFNGPRFNADGTRYTYTVVPTAGMHSVFEGMTSVAAPLVSVTSGTNIIPATYVSLTRAVALDQTPRRVLDIKSGVAMAETDISPMAAPFTVSGALTIWPTQTTNKLKAFLGDGPTATIDEPVLPLGVTAGGGYGAGCGVVFSNGSTWVVNNMNTNVKKISGFSAALGSTHIAMLDVIVATRMSGAPEFYDCTNDFTVETTENGTAFSLTVDEVAGFAVNPLRANVLRLGVMR